MGFFSHLHVHSEYSLMESTIRIKDLVSTAARNGMEAVALTDKHTMSGTVEFYREAIMKNIKPIAGCEIRVVRSGVTSRLVILIKNTKGYENLCQLISKSNMESRTPAPSVKISDLGKKSGGLIGLSCCRNGEISQLLEQEKAKSALRSAEYYRELFNGNFFLEIQRYPKTKSILSSSLPSEILVNFALRNNIPMVATNDVHYLNRADYPIYRCLSKIKSMAMMAVPDADFVSNDEHYFKSTSEMASLFPDIRQAVFNTMAIADMCRLELPLGSIIFPHFKVPGGKKEDEHLKKLCRQGLKWRYGSGPSPDILRRLKKELEVITETGFCGYFLIVADIARFARQHEIPICGKGSSAGSLVSYILGISNVDPVKNNLYFERFLNRERKEPPDIDIDLSHKRRAEIVRYLELKYGKNNISRVCTFSTLKPRAAIREAGRFLGYSKEDVDRIANTYSPSFSSGLAGRQCSGITAGGHKYPDTANTQHKKITCISKKIENYVRHTSLHPSAFIISSTDLTKKIPLALSRTGETMSQYGKDSIEDLGLLKIDLINSLNLSLLEDVPKMLKAGRNIDLDIRELGYHDSKTFDLIKNGNTLGVFQLESYGIRKLAKKIKPATLNDITFLISLYRPGPQQSGMVKNFIERKFGREKIVYLHRDLEPILSETYGIILYQEQVMQIAVIIAGYSLSEADNLRKAMTKLSKKEMERQKERFIRGAAGRGYHIKTAKEIFKLVSKFASYGFVKAHAAAYAELSYKTCYIKAHYPAELLSIILTDDSGYYGRAQYIEEARRSGIKIKLPDINSSSYKFSVEDDGKSIRIPLTSVRELGQTGAGSIIRERDRNGRFKDFTDFYCRISKSGRGIPGKAAVNLIKVGAFDFTGIKRKYLLLSYLYMASGRTIGGGRSHPLPCREGPLKDFGILETLEMEEKILGFCASRSPLDYFKSELEDYRRVRSGLFEDIAGSKENIFAAGIIITRKIKKTRNGENILLCTLEDEDGMYESVFFPNTYKKNLRTISGQSPVIIKGRVCSRDGHVFLVGKNSASLSGIKKIRSRARKDSIKNNLLVRAGSAWEMQEK
jgi:DNA polymerase-3 subunit alpha